MGVASGCGEQEAGVASGSGWNLWMWLVGVVVRRYNYRFPHTTYPYSSCIFFCSSSIPTFCSFLKCFSFFIIIIIQTAKSLSRLGGARNLLHCQSDG